MHFNGWVHDNAPLLLQLLKVAPAGAQDLDEQNLRVSGRISSLSRPVACAVCAPRVPAPLAHMGSAAGTRGARGRPNRVKGRPKFCERIRYQEPEKPCKSRQNNTFRIILNSQRKFVKRGKDNVKGKTKTTVCRK